MRRSSEWLISTVLVLCVTACGAQDHAAGAPPSMGKAPPEAPKPTVVIVGNGDGKAAFGRRQVPEGQGSYSERLSTLLLVLAAEPETKAIVLAPSPKGSAAALRRVRATRPKLILISVAPAEEALLMESSADLVGELVPPLKIEDEEASVTGDLFDGFTEGLAELARRVAGGGARIDGLEDILAALRGSSPGAHWAASYYVDPASGVRAKNHIVVTANPK